MKIIALACSPSRGRNSDTMLDYFIDGAKTEKGIEIEKIYLSDVPIDYYTFENSKAPATHETAFAELAEKIKNTNALVIATPTYNFSVPAQLKNLIDRLRFIELDMGRKNLLGQPVGMLAYLRTYFLVSGGTPTWAQKILFFAFPPFWLRAVFLYFNAHVLGALYTGDVKSFQDEAFHRKCFKKGKKFAKDLNAGRKNRLLENIFWRPPQTRE